MLKSNPKKNINVITLPQRHMLQMFLDSCNEYFFISVGATTNSLCSLHTFSVKTKLVPLVEILNVLFYSSIIGLISLLYSVSTIEGIGKVSADLCKKKVKIVTGRLGHSKVCWCGKIIVG